jgi:hypothetical protein
LGKPEELRGADYEIKEITCYACGYPTLSADEAEWQLGGALDVYLKCSRCDGEPPLTLPPDDYRRCGFAPDANVPGDVL